jgi:Chaperone for flagella basal body P-ring formation
MKLLLGLLLFLNFNSFACELSFPHQLVILSQDLAATAFSQRGCDPAVTTEAARLLAALEGRVNANHLVEALSQKGFTNVSIGPQTFIVTQLRTLVREQVSLPPGVQVKNTRGLNSSGMIALAPGDRVEVECLNCLFGTQQPMNVNHIGFDGVNRAYMVSVDFKRMVRAFRVVQPITSFSEVSPTDHLREVFVETVPHTELVIDLDKLRFYKTNKPLKAGELLRMADLGGINLVKAGLKTEVILENSLVRIKTHGISRMNGTIGDVVEVFHPQKNKKYQGKVVDINKVLVEL